MVHHAHTCQLAVGVAGCDSAACGGGGDGCPPNVRDPYPAERNRSYRSASRHLEAPRCDLSVRDTFVFADTFIFARDTFILPTNNAAERALRPAVAMRKITGGSRSKDAAAAWAKLASLLRNSVRLCASCEGRRFMMRRSWSFRVVAIFALALSAAPIATADNPTDSIDATQRKEVIDRLIEKINGNYVLPEAAKKMEAAIRAKQMKGKYDAIVRGEILATALTEDLRQVCHDGHLSVEYFPTGIPYDSEKPPVPADVQHFREQGRRRNYSFRKVERLGGGVGLLQVDGFYPAEWIAKTLDGAMSFLENSDAIIVDLRQNHGGSSGGTLLCSYFLREETHLEDFYNRAENSTKQIWSYPVAASAKFADKDLYILTSHETFSAPEMLAYDLQVLKRATIVGETTGGGAHGTTAYRITDHFSASIPFARSINPVTHADWEGVGVKPDVAVPAGQALLTAHILAMKRLVDRNSGNPEWVGELRRAIAAKEKELKDLQSVPVSTKSR